VVSGEPLLAQGVDYRFAIDLFNGREVPTGLRDIAIEIVRDDGGPLISPPVTWRAYNLIRW
jgi:hypothetical protein